MKFDKILLSWPEFTSEDQGAISTAIRAIGNAEEINFIEIFENEIASIHDIEHVVAVNSGTAAIHLALLALGVKSGDKVIIPTLTFAATAFPVMYIGATPVFIDSDSRNSNLNLDLLETYLRNCKKIDLPKAIIAVDLFGRVCDYDNLLRIADNYEIPVLIDSAESLGSLYKGKPTTSYGALSTLSFNFNKLVTTTSGGAILTNNLQFARLAKKLANQARENFHWYEHSNIGYNYRMSPILAALGSSQIKRVESNLNSRRNIRNRYFENFKELNGIDIPMDQNNERSNAWLTIINFSSELFPNANELVRSGLAIKNIETRFIWKPLHLQPIFQSYETCLNGISEKLFSESLCLPSSSTLSLQEVDYICSEIISILKL